MRTGDTRQGGNFHLEKFARTVTGAYLLADKGHALLKVSATANGVDVVLPSKAPDSIASVLVLKTN